MVVGAAKRLKGTPGKGTFLCDSEGTGGFWPSGFCEPPEDGSQRANVTVRSR